MESNPTLRRAGTDDAASLAALSIEVWIGTYLRLGVSAFVADYVLDTFTSAKLAEVLADANEYILVSENTDGIDGFIRVTKGSTAPVPGCSDTEITTLYVQPRHHGKARGKALLDAALDHCRKEGDSAVWLATNSENTPAIGFYQAQGFEQVGHTHFRLKDQAYLNNVYSCQLN